VALCGVFLVFAVHRKALQKSSFGVARAAHQIQRYALQRRARALCDSRSIALAVVASYLVYPDKVGETYAFVFNPRDVGVARHGAHLRVVASASRVRRGCVAGASRAATTACSGSRSSGFSGSRGRA
jgi:hypothetical protein